MAELPELSILCDQISNELTGKTFSDADIRQEKCLNISKDSFLNKLLGTKVVKAYNKGKWIFIKLTNEGNLLINVGMGGDILYYGPNSSWNDEYQARFHFSDFSGFTCKFWWFGHIEFLDSTELLTHKPTKDIAFSPFDKEFTFESFKKLFEGKRTRIKNILLDQSKIGGIGNAYIHDILFLSRLHPNQQANVLNSDEVQNLYASTKNYLSNARDRKGCAYERDFYGAKGNFEFSDYIVGYHEGSPCPNCGTRIQKIKTGSTSSFICQKCQELHD